MTEVHQADTIGLYRLAAMGLRAVLDVTCNDILNGDVGNFTDKLNALVQRGHMPGQQKKHVDNVLDIGHAVIHRGHAPSQKDIGVFRVIVEDMLKGFYISGPASEKAKKKVPARKRYNKTIA